MKAALAQRQLLKEEEQQQGVFAYFSPLLSTRYPQLSTRGVEFGLMLTQARVLPVRRAIPLLLATRTKKMNRALYRSPTSDSVPDSTSASRGLKLAGGMGNWLAWR